MEHIEAIQRFSLAIKLLRFACLTCLSKRQARDRGTSLSIDEGSSCGSADKLLCFRNLNCLRFRLTDDCLTNFLWLNNATLLANDFWISYNSLDINDFWFGYNALLVHNARLADFFRLINQSWFEDFLCLRHDVLVDHSALCVNDLFLADDTRRLLNLDKLRATLLWRTNLRALWHRAKLLSCVAFWIALQREDTLLAKEIQSPSIMLRLTSVFSQGTQGELVQDISKLIWKVSLEF